MPQIVGKDNSMLEKTIVKQAQSEYYDNIARNIVFTIGHLCDFYRSGYKLGCREEEIVNPSQEDIDGVMYEFTHDMIPNELMIILSVCINKAERLLTDKEICQITKIYELKKEKEE